MNKIILDLNYFQLKECYLRKVPIGFKDMNKDIVHFQIGYFDISMLIENVYKEF